MFQASCNVSTNMYTFVYTQTCTHTDLYPDKIGILDCNISNCCWKTLFGIVSVEKSGLVKRVLNRTKNSSLHQTAFLNTSESKQIFSTTHDIVCCMMGGNIKESGWDTYPVCVGTPKISKGDNY